MKNIKIATVLFSILFIIGAVGCSKKTSQSAVVTVCDTLLCHNGGTCASGACQCAGNFTGSHCDSCIAGYEGANCNVLHSAKFVGSYAGSDTCSGTVSPDNWIISAGPTLSQLQISVAGITLLANFSGYTFTIPAQGQSGLTFNSGTGTVNGNNIVITYNYSNSSTTQTCTFGGTK